MNYKDALYLAIKYMEDEIKNGNKANEQLKNKLSDISLIWSAYNEIINPNYSDNLDDIVSLCDKLREHKNYFKDTNVYIDSFYSFTKSQLDVIKEIFKQAENVTIAFDCPIDTPSGAMQYAKITDARDRLYAICKNDLKIEYSNENFDKDYKHINKDIKTVCDNLWNFSAENIGKTEGINLVLAGDEFEECEYVASKIKELILKGEKYSSIAVLMRNADTYKGIIDFSFKKFEIPYFYSITTDIASMPVIKMVFSALNSISGYRYEDIISYLKCGYTSIAESDLNDFESYTYRWNIYGKKFKDDDYWASNPDGYVSNPTIIQMQTLSRIVDTRDKVIEKLNILENCFKGKCTVRDASSAVFKFLEAHDIKTQLQKEIDECKSRKDAYELSQVWNVFVSALDEMVKICGDTEVDVDEYVSLLKHALSENAIGTIPSGEDNVLIGDAPTVRAKNIKHVFILGVNEGVFPKEISDEGFFTDTDKITLETLGLNLTDNSDIKSFTNSGVNFELSSKSEARSDDELLSFRHALSIASHTVTVSCLKTNIKGTAMLPSIAFLRLKTLLGIEKPYDTSSLAFIDRIYTDENAYEFLGSSDKNIADAVKEYFGIEKDVVEPFYNDRLSIDEKTAELVFGDHIALSKSSMETFASCKFKYYCDYVLKLKSSKRITFASNDVGTLNHLIIEKFFNMKKNNEIDIEKITQDDVEVIVKDIITDYSNLICTSKNVSKKLRYLFNKLKKNLIIYLMELVEELKQSKFDEQYMELSLSGDGINAPKPRNFKIDGGKTASLIGTADRVDVYRDDKDTYVKIIDYKSGVEKISLDLLDKGYGAQLFIYLFTLCKMDDCDFKKAFKKGTESIKPAGIMYFPMNISKNGVKYDVDLESDTLNDLEKEITIDRIERSGYFLDDVNVIEAQDKSGEGRFIPNKNEHKDWYKSLNDFDEIYKKLEQTINTIGTKIFSGVASAIPDKSKKDPCEYCEHNLVCRRRYNG